MTHNVAHTQDPDFPGQPTERRDKQPVNTPPKRP